jgi:pyruvate ferredoxin oxidoreductase gamma subunit
MEQIRIHGRGGQGVVTAAELIARAAFYEGREAVAFPNFGVERTGAPIQSYVRISDEEILTREQIYAPTVLVIQDATLLSNPAIFIGADKDTRIIINAEAGRDLKLPFTTKNVWFAPATAVALKIFGKNIVNTIILGALAKHTGLISLASLEKAIRDKFADKGEEIINKNIAAIKIIYAQ